MRLSNFQKKMILSTQWIMINKSTKPSIKSELKNISKLHFISKQLTNKLERHKLLLHNIIVLWKLKGSCCLCLLMVSKQLPWMYQILQRTEMDSLAKTLFWEKSKRWPSAYSVAYFYSILLYWAEHRNLLILLAWKCRAHNVTIERVCAYGERSSLLSSDSANN